MSKRMSTIYVGGTMIVGFALVLTHYHLTKGVHILINNASSAVLSNMELIYSGGTKHIEELNPNATFETHINPKSASHLNLIWTDPMGEKHFDLIDVYFESDYMGNVRIIINPDYEISWVDNIRLAPLGNIGGSTRWDLYE